MAKPKICKKCNGIGYQTGLCDFSWGWRVKSIPCTCNEGKKIAMIQKIEDDFVRGYILGRLGKKVNIPEEYQHILNKSI